MLLIHSYSSRAELLLAIEILFRCCRVLRHDHKSYTNCIHRYSLNSKLSKLCMILWFYSLNKTLVLLTSIYECITERLNQNPVKHLRWSVLQKQSTAFKDTVVQLENTLTSISEKSAAFNVTGMCNLQAVVRRLAARQVKRTWPLIYEFTY